MSKAVVLLSGGLDSSTVLAMAKERGHEVIALTFDYGQRHDKEVECARAVAEALGASEHIVMSMPIGHLLDSSLTRADREVPEGRSRSEIGAGVPSTYVPSRNIIFLSVAASIAESVGAEAVFIAANAVDFSGYPDCTPEFLYAFQRVLESGTKAGKEGRPIRVEAPVMDMTKAGIDCYMSQGTINALGVSGHRIKVVRAHEPVRIGTWTVLPFRPKRGGSTVMNT